MLTKSRAAIMFALIVTGLHGFMNMACASEEFTIRSPDGNLSIVFALKSNPPPYISGERPYYRVSCKGVPILADSPLGLDLVGQPPLEQDFDILGSARDSRDTAWDNPFGTRRVVPDRYNELTISLQERNAPKRRLHLIFRAYDEGVAFRYVVPKQEGLERFTLSAESTGFYFARDVFAFALNLGKYTSNYESEFRRVRPEEIEPTSIVGLPLLVEIPGGPWVALLEADLTDYAGMYVGGVARVPNGLVSKLAPHPDHAEQAVVASTPKASPWRILLINERVGGLIETNYLVLNLSAPCALADTSWIKPGKAAWDWWSGSFARNVSFKPGMNTETMKHYVDFAAAHHLEYMLVDAGWYPAADYTHPVDILRHVPEVNVPEIIAYAAAKGVKVLLWVFWGALDKHMDEALALYSKWGAAGIKVDFMDRDDQEMVNFYERVVRKAAEHRMVVDFHGAYKPTGLRRTYPNLLTREGIMGLEYSKWSTRVTPEHDVTIPFTRMLAGPMDYTPGGFRNATREQFKPQFIEPMTQGTRAHELAKYVVFESPLVMVSDYPEAYQNQPGFDFIVKVPTVWDQTRVVLGEVGRYIAIARQKHDDWYLGAMTNWEARDVEIPLAFLGADEYEAHIFADGPDADRVATSLSISRRRVGSRDKLNVHLAPGGGLAVIFDRMK